MSDSFLPKGMGIEGYGCGGLLIETTGTDEGRGWPLLCAGAGVKKVGPYDRDFSLGIKYLRFSADGKQYADGGKGTKAPYIADLFQLVISKIDYKKELLGIKGPFFTRSDNFAGLGWLKFPGQNPYVGGEDVPLEGEKFTTLIFGGALYFGARLRIGDGVYLEPSIGIDSGTIYPLGSIRGKSGFPSSPFYLAVMFRLNISLDNPEENPSAGGGQPGQDQPITAHYTAHIFINSGLSLIQRLLQHKLYEDDAGYATDYLENEIGIKFGASQQTRDLSLLYSILSIQRAFNMIEKVEYIYAAHKSDSYAGYWLMGAHGVAGLLSLIFGAQAGGRKGEGLMQTGGEDALTIAGGLIAISGLDYRLQLALNEASGFLTQIIGDLAKDKLGNTSISKAGMVKMFSVNFSPDQTRGRTEDGTEFIYRPYNKILKGGDGATSSLEYRKHLQGNTFFTKVELDAPHLYPGSFATRGPADKVEPYPAKIRTGMGAKLEAGPFESSISAHTAQEFGSHPKVDVGVSLDVMAKIKLSEKFSLKLGGRVLTETDLKGNGTVTIGSGAGIEW